MIDLHIWEFPLSILAAAAFAVAVSLCRRCPGRRLSAGLAALCALLMAVEGTWAPGLHRHWAFLVFMAVLMFALGTVCADALRSGLRRGRPGSRRDGGRSVGSSGDDGRSVGGRSTGSGGDGGRSVGGRKDGGRFWRLSAGVWSHLGLLLILSGAFFGAPDVTDVTMVAERGKASHFAWNAAGETVPLPFELQLEDFTIDYYEDGVSPKQYTSTLRIGNELREVSVNRPLRIGGYRIYQSDYDHESGGYSVLKVVRNPWLPLVCAGMAILVLAALAGLRKTWQSKAVIPVAIVLAAVFGAISLARVKLGTLMPALRSLWFVPHIIAYMLAYSALALALVCGILGLCGGSRRASRSRGGMQDGCVHRDGMKGVSFCAGTGMLPCVDEPARESTCRLFIGEPARESTRRLFIGEPAWKLSRRLLIGEPAWKLSRRLLETASALLAAGMFCGSVWAQNSWGDWWAWDAKECWAAATWLLTLAGTHLPVGTSGTQYLAGCTAAPGTHLPVGTSGTGCTAVAGTHLPVGTSGTQHLAGCTAVAGTHLPVGTSGTQHLAGCTAVAGTHLPVGTSGTQDPAGCTAATEAGCATGWKKVAFALLALSFLAMQVTWYGVDYLPAARTSLHTYTQSK